MRRIAPALAVVFGPTTAFAHDAFGDLGPFYASLLHPLADPAQGLLLVAVAVALAVQPLDTVRPAYAVAILAAAAAILAGAIVGLEAPALRIFALAAMLLGLIALSPMRLSPWVGAAIAGVAATAAGLAVDLPPNPRAAGMAALGSCLGIALTVLLVWGAVDIARRRIGTVAGAVAGSWVAAIGLMTAVLPT
jgi:urease accessory protein